MTPNQFLSYSIKHECYRNPSWLISIFALTRETEEQKKNDRYPGKLCIEPFGHFVLLEDGTQEKIETSKKPDEVLFKLTDPITIDESYYPGLTGKIETTVARLFLNLITIYAVFGKKVQYINKLFTPSYVEDLIAPVMLSDVKEGENEDPTKIYCRELLDFQSAVNYMEMFTPIFANSITRVGLRPTPGRKEFKKEALKRYEGKMNDPVEMAKLDQEFQAFDDAYLKTDPAYGKFMKGKIKGARVSGFLAIGGASNGFSESMEVTPITASLEDGIPMDAEGFTAMANTTRFGSFSRGAETVNGGVTAKLLMRAADNWRITKGDCGSKLGISRIYAGKDIKQLIGRYILDGAQVKLIENEAQASTYEQRKIRIRSPQYCSRGKTQTCEVCAGVALAKYPTGLTIPLSELSGGILSDSLKQMHASKLEAVTMSLREVIS